MLRSSQKKLPTNGVPATESSSFFVCVQRRLLIFLHVEPPHFLGPLNFSVGTFLDYVETTDLDGAGHAVETMDASSEAPELLSEDIPRRNRESRKS